MRARVALLGATARAGRAVLLSRAALFSGVLCSSALLLGCGPGNGDESTKIINGNAPRRADGTIINDRSMCNFRGRTDVEVSETAGPGAIQPNVRRVWKVFGHGADRRRILMCREIDTNLDGYKDVVRLYNDEGQAKKEMADTNHDGKVDTWNLFSQGRIAEVHLDKNFDGEPDEWKIYNEGKLSRVRRDTNFDKKPDTWEMYHRGRLERMGVDLDGDERVDRWDHDKEWKKRLEEERKKKDAADEKLREEKMEKLRKEGEEAAAKANEGDG